MQRKDNDAFKFKTQLWSPWFIQKKFSVVRVILSGQAHHLLLVRVVTKSNSLLMLTVTVKIL